MTAARSSARSPAARAAWISAPHRLIVGKSLRITGTLLGSDPQTFSLQLTAGSIAAAIDMSSHRSFSRLRTVADG
jgi:hypothetical protein